MANPTNFPGDLVLAAQNTTIRHPGGLNFAPKLTKANLIDSAEQTYTIPLSRFQMPVGGDMTCGTGISAGTNTICEHSITRSGGLIKTEILLDLTGLNEGGTAQDIIGDDGGTVNCHLGQITTAVNGTIIAGRIHCLEVPAGGDVDIDFYGSADEESGAQDATLATLTGEEQLIDHGNWAANEIDELTALPDADGYLYITTGSGTTPADADYTGGIFLIELWGTPTTQENLIYVQGTHGTNAPSLQTPDFGDNSAAAIYYARGEVQLPGDYVATESVKIRVHAGMLTTVASEEATVDLEVYKSDEDSTSTGDLCSTAATTDNMNSLTFADVDFTITAATLNPGDILDVRIKVTVDDDGDAGVMKGCVGSVQLLCNVR